MYVIDRKPQLSELLNPLPDLTALIDSTVPMTYMSLIHINSPLNSIEVVRANAQLHIVHLFLDPYLCGLKHQA